MIAAVVFACVLGLVGLILGAYATAEVNSLDDRSKSNVSLTAFCLVGTHAARSSAFLFVVKLLCLYQSTW
jgi:hypothetical protein